MLRRILHQRLVVRVAHRVRVKGVVLGNRDNIIQATGLRVADDAELDVPKNLLASRRERRDRLRATHRRRIRARALRIRIVRTRRRYGAGRESSRVRIVRPLIHERRHHLDNVKLLTAEILRNPLANRLGIARRARERREIPLKVLNLVNKVAHVIQTRSCPHPAMRDGLKEKPCDAGLLMVEEGQELKKRRLIHGIRVAGLLEVLKDGLNLRRHTEAVIPLLKNISPADNADVRVSIPQARGNGRGHFNELD